MARGLPVALGRPAVEPLLRESELRAGFSPASLVAMPAGGSIILKLVIFVQFAGLASSWSGASSPERVIRLRRAPARVGTA